MHDPSDDRTLYPVPQAFEILTGKRPNPTTCWRWSVGKNRGMDVKLEVTSFGGRMMVTLAACSRFLNALTKSREERISRTLQQDRRTTREQKAAEAAKQKLRELVNRHSRNHLRKPRPKRGQSLIVNKR